MPVRRAVLGIVVFVLLGLLLFALVLVPFAPLVIGEGTLDELARRPTVGLLLLQGVGLLGAFGLATVIVARWLSLDLADLRWLTRL
jgi:hypothetical protein